MANNLEAIQIVDEIEILITKNDLVAASNHLMQLLQLLTDGSYIKNSIVSATSTLFEIKRKELSHLESYDEIRRLKNIAINQLLNCFKEIRHEADNDDLFLKESKSIIEELNDHLGKAKDNIESFESLLLKFLRTELASEEEIKEVLSLKSDFFTILKKFKKSSNKIIYNAKMKKKIRAKIIFTGIELEEDSTDEGVGIVEKIVNILSSDNKREVHVQSFDISGENYHFNGVAELLIEKENFVDDIGIELLELDQIKSIETSIIKDEKEQSRMKISSE